MSVTPSPLASPEVIAEEPLREDGEEHQTAGQDRLHGRERGEHERLDVQPPREQRKDPANREPPLAKQICGTPDAGQRTRIGRASTAPRALNKALKLVPNAHTSAKPSPRIIANAAACLADARFSIEYRQASTTHDHEVSSSSHGVWWPRSAQP